MVVTMETEKQSTALKLHTPNPASTAKSADQSPRPTTSKLANGFEITMAGGQWCLDCGETVRACDVEPIGDGCAMQLCCKACGSLIFKYEQF
jgi:hypothetical protein